MKRATKFIPFTYTGKEKFEKAKLEVSVGSYVNIHTNRGLFYGKIIKFDEEHFSLKQNEKTPTRHHLWDSIDSISLMGDE